MVASSTVSDFYRPLVAADHFFYAYPGAPGWVLRDISLRIHAGECHLLEGPTGSGKTTLLLAIRDLLPPGRQAGKIRRATPAPNSHAAHPGLLLQNPKTQLLCSSLGADVAFGLENLCVTPSLMPQTVLEALNRVGLAQPLDRPVDALSMGQQYRACLAGVLVMAPALMMLDEPMAQLDAQGQDRLLAVVRDLKLSGRAVLICDHRPKGLRTIADRTWQMDARGQLRETTNEAQPAQILMDSMPKALAPQAATNARAPRDTHGSMDSPGETILRVKGLKFDHPDGELDLSAISFCVAQGERVVINGANGTGKTTLAGCLSGLRRPSSGTVEVFGRRPRLADLRGRMTVLFQDPRRQIFETTVFDEVAFAARRNGMPGTRVKDAVEDILYKLDLSHLSESSPHKLSYGQKHLVGLAAVLAAKPKLVVLDDPFAGLDVRRSRLVMDQVASIARDWGTSVVWTTHDLQAVTGWADRVITLPDRNGAPSASAPKALKAATRRLELGTGVMLCLCLLLSMSAFAIRSPALLASLSGLNLLLIAVACPKPLSLLRKSMFFFLWQAAMVVVLYMIRFGATAGVASGVMVGWQLFLALWPGVIFMSSNAQSKIVATLSRVMPHRTAFVAAVCLRFLPLLLSEMQQIRAAQTLRGARLLAADLKAPRFWPDWIHCLMVPALIKTLSLSGDIATAATARDFGVQSERTAWPGE